MARQVLIALVAALAAAATACAHPDSLSTSRISMGTTSRHLLRCQTLSLLEVLPQIDLDGDGSLIPRELEAGRAAIFAYVDLRYDVGGLAPRGLRVSIASRDPDDNDDPFRAFQWIDVERALGGDARPALAVTTSIFMETSPDHTDICTLVWPDGREQTRVLSSRRRMVEFDSRAVSVLGEFTVLGARHILGGWDHLAFLVALLLAAPRRLAPMLLTVTAFTLAHSITLAAAALRIITLDAELVEIGIALSIAYVAADTLLHPTARRSRALEAALFGLIHGFGFSGFLTTSLIGTHARLPALAGFNLGVEIGQLLVVTVLAALLLRIRANDPGFLAPHWLRRAGSAALLVAGLTWFVQRVA